MGTNAPIRRTIEEPKRVGNPYYQPRRIAPTEKPPEVAPPRREPERVPA